MAHIDGAQLGSHTTAGVLDTVLVPLSGWTDLAEIRQVGHRWLRHRHTTQKGLPAPQPTTGTR